MGADSTSKAQPSSGRAWQTIDLAGARQRTWTNSTDDVGNVEQVVETVDCEANVTVGGEMLAGPVTKAACMTISSTGTTIESGTVIFRAGESIELSDFTVKAGATFIAENDSRIAGLAFTYDYLEPQYFLSCASGPWRITHVAMRRPVLQPRRRSGPTASR